MVDCAVASVCSQSYCKIINIAPYSTEGSHVVPESNCSGSMGLVAVAMDRIPMLLLKYSNETLITPAQQLIAMQPL